MKIGILTLYKNGYNYGAQLQAYALCKFLNNYGECEQIQYLHQDTDSHYWFKELKAARKMEEFSRSIPHSDDVYDNFSIHETVDKYDVFVCGSDQIWGEKVCVPYENTAVFTLTFVPDFKTKIAYAASLGGKVANRKYSEILEGTIKNIDFVSTREKSSVPYLESIAKKNVENVADPAFLLDREEWEELLVKPEIEEPFDVVYMLSEKNREIAYQSERKVVYINPQEINAGPPEFLGYIKYAENVITDSYHGIVFSIIFRKRFVAVSKDSVLDIRLKDLFETLSIKYELAGDINVIYRKIRSYDFCNYDCIEKAFGQLKDKSISFLENALNHEKCERCIISENRCTGCGACAAVCPVGCIQWKEGYRGFHYPVVDREKCIGCNRCYDACPMVSFDDFVEKHGNKGCEPYVCSAVNKNKEILLSSSSGGVFHELAEYVLARDGVVYGVRYDDEFNIVGGRAERMEDVIPFLTGKYAQSDNTGIYGRVKEDLDAHRVVLMTGTPCQNGGLIKFLGRKYDNLITIDFVCRGVLSNGLWKKYVKNLEQSGKVEKVNMRDKSGEIIDAEGLYKPVISVKYEDGTIYRGTCNEDMYLSFYDEFVLFRDCCYNCSFRGNNRFSDITMADFHGTREIEKEQKDHGPGSSIVFINSVKGQKIWEGISGKFIWNKQDFAEVLKYNYPYDKSYWLKDFIYFLDSIYESSSIDRIYEEFRSCSYRSSERIYYWKKRTLEECGKRLSAYNDGEINIKDTILYGLGSLGKMLYEKMEYKPACIIERNQDLKKYKETKVLAPFNRELEAYVKDNLVIVTPITDSAAIVRMLKKTYGQVRIITITDLLGI